jgi:hypothetical protein
MLLWKHPPTAAPQLWHTTGEAAPGRIDCTYHGCSRVTGPSEACNFDTQQACITRSSIQLNHAVYRCESRPLSSPPTTGASGPTSVTSLYLTSPDPVNPPLLG